MNLTNKIFVSMLLGMAVGIGLSFISADNPLRYFLIADIFTVIGEIFFACLKMLVVPVVFVSLVCGAASLKDVRELGIVGGKTLLLYLLTTVLAITLALAAAFIFHPGSGFEIATPSTFHPLPPPPLTQALVDIVPTNIIESMAEGKMLQVILFALLIGISLTLIDNKSNHILSLFKEANEVLMKIVSLLMHLAPYGVFCLLAKVFAEQGISAIRPLASYFTLVASVLLIHGFVSYGLLLRFLGNLNPLPFFRKFRSVMLFAFSTSSSNATLPITLRNVEENLGVDNSIASFSIPLGATLNMDGSAIMQGIATVFIANAYNIDISLTGYLMVILTTTLASIGTAGVPGVALVTLAMVLKQVGLPEEGIAYILGVDRILDMMRTAVNVTGDAAVTCLVAKSEKKLNLETFSSR